MWYTLPWFYLQLRFGAVVSPLTGALLRKLITSSTVPSRASETKSSAAFQLLLNPNSRKVPRRNPRIFSSFFLSQDRKKVAKNSEKNQIPLSSLPLSFTHFRLRIQSRTKAQRKNCFQDIFFIIFLNVANFWLNHPTCHFRKIYEIFIVKDWYGFKLFFIRVEKKEKIKRKKMGTWNLIKKNTLFPTIYAPDRKAIFPAVHKYLQLYQRLQLLCTVSYVVKWGLTYAFCCS